MWKTFRKLFLLGAWFVIFYLKKNKDIDIATEAKPEEILCLLKKNNIAFDSKNKNFGIVLAKQGSLVAEIATFRKETYTGSRYPKIQFITNTKQDSHRRDFSINALYLSPKTNRILDFHKGLADIKFKTLKFIGNPQKRIKEDPLRILRALRFIYDLNLNFSSKTKKTIEKNLLLLKFLTKSRIKKEIFIIKNKKIQNHVKKILIEGKSLDIIEKKF